jgi:hypothetical protein
LLTAATAIQIAIALIVLTRPSRDDDESAERARPATVAVLKRDEQSPARAQTLPFAVRKEGFYRRGAAGSRPRTRGKIGGSASTKVDRPKPRLAPSPPPPPPPRATIANPPPPSSETTNAAGRPPPQTVAQSPGGGGDDEDDDDEEEEDDEGDDDDGGDDDDDEGGGGEDDD